MRKLRFRTEIVFNDGQSQLSYKKTVEGSDREGERREKKEAVQIELTGKKREFMARMKPGEELRVGERGK